ncbi:MAG: DNA polymerase III subunit alpha [Bacteroidales bacterium]|nr:DNA polymerase III subunit alpha [Candidatus Colicola coprequi]
MSFTHLHVHSHYSVLDGMSKVPDLVDKCIRTGMPAIALTDHGNMYGIKELLDYCKGINAKREEQAKADGTTYVPFKPIVGVEAYCARRKRTLRDKNLKATNADGKQYTVDISGWHLILLAKNMTGYHSLCHIVSESFMDDCFYRTPRIDKELLEQYHEGLICSSACLGGELSQKVMMGIVQGATLDNGGFQDAEETIQWFKRLFGDDYYIELQRHQTDKIRGNQSTYQRQMAVNAVLVELAKKYNVKVIATNDSHFTEEDEADAHELLVLLNTGKKLNVSGQDDKPDKESGDAEMAYTKQEWLKTPEEMSAIFSDIPEAISNTQEIVDKVEIYNIDHKPIMPKFPIPESFANEQDYIDKYGEDDYRIHLEGDYLTYLTWEGAKKRYGEERIQNDEELKERINFELNTMISMGFPGYFLIVMDFIRGAREELGVSVGPGRGSAAGSVVAYCLHITDLDPLKYDLLFERFLNPDRISLPDIDTDFDDAGRGKVLDWVSNKYGRTHVAHIITYGAMATKSALADVGRVMNLPLPRVNELKSYVPERSFPDNIVDEKGKSPKVNLKNCYKYVNELKDILNGDNVTEQAMLKYASDLEGTIRQIGIHACGVIIGADDLTKFAPLSSVEDKDSNQRVLVTQYDGHVVESVGLIKMDFLGLKTLTIIKECLNNIKKAKDIDVDIDHIPIDDAETYRLFQEGRTIAVFQFESVGMQKYMKELKPTVIGDLIAMNALYRPGPMAYIPQFIRRKHGQEEVTYDIPIMEKYLKDTYGVTVYQEQVMLLSRLLANFTRGESDKLRKAMGKKQMAVLQALKSKFMDGGKQNGHDEKILEKIWKDWEAFASYAFNKSHAACYSWLAYQTGYLKAHYPAEFMAANLTVSKDDIKEVTKFMDECKAMHINVLGPDINESDLNFTVNQKGDIRFGLGGIKGVGEGAVEAIVSERQEHGKYQDIYDFMERINLTACNKKTIESLAISGGFDCFEGLYREQLLSINEKGDNMLDVLIRYGNLYQNDKREQQNTLFGGDDFAVEIQKPELLQVPHMTTIERLNKEKSLIGIFLSAHPLDEYEFEVRELATLTTKDLTWLEDHRKEVEYQTRDGKKKTRRRICLKDWEGIFTNSESADDTSSGLSDESVDVPTEESGEVIDVHKQLKDFLEKYKNTPIRIGGIVTSSEEKVSAKGFPFGSYTIEDYEGSYRMGLFGKAYEQCAPMLKPNLYVMITFKLQQIGEGQSWFRPKAIEEAEYELIADHVELLDNVQDKYLDSLTISIPLENITSELGRDIAETTHAHSGQAKLKINILDESQGTQISFTSQTNSIKINKQLYHWLKSWEQDKTFTHQIKTR